MESPLSGDAAIKELVDVIRRLDPKERELVEVIVEDLLRDGKSDLLALTNALLYDEIPVDPEKWLMDPLYMGNVGREMFPKLRDDFIDTFIGNYVEVILTGGIGWGKSWWTELALLRCVYEAGCYKNPARAFGLATGSSLMFVNISIKEELARKVIFQGMKVKAAASPYFTDRLPFDKTVSTELRFPKGITVFPAASTTTSILGLNILGGAVDETNFMPVTNEGKIDPVTGRKKSDKAETLYTSFSRRMKSRFAEMGMLPGKLFLVSSASIPNSFLERRVSEAEHDKTVKILQYSQWGPKPRNKFSATTFKVEVGDMTRKSRILPSTVDPKTVRGRVVEVPDDFRKDFDDDIEGSLQDFAGVPVMSIQPFFRDYDRLIACFGSKRPHPFTAETTDLEDNVGLLLDTLTTLKDGKRIPLLNPRLPRWAHVDTSLSQDATGIAMGHISDMMLSETTGELAPKITIDFMMRVTPPIGREISLQKMREFLYRFIAIGFPLVGISTDRFQSADTLQMFRDRGVYATILSVDNLESYKTLKNTFYEGRVDAYFYEPVIMEARTLQWRPDLKKPDHPPKGSKDVLDALCGVVCALHKFKIRNPADFEDNSEVSIL